MPGSDKDTFINETLAAQAYNEAKAQPASARPDVYPDDVLMRMAQMASPTQRVADIVFAVAQTVRDVCLARVPAPAVSVELAARLIAVLKEFEEADINDGLSQERLKAVNDRAYRLWLEWRKEPTDELNNRRRENLDKCLRLADVAAVARRRKRAAREAIQRVLIDVALTPTVPAALQRARETGAE